MDQVFRQGLCWKSLGIQCLGRLLEREHRIVHAAATRACYKLFLWRAKLLYQVDGPRRLCSRLLGAKSPKCSFYKPLTECLEEQFRRV